MLLGQPTQAGAYAQDVTYHPNGAIAGFTYGNGITHTLSQNLRGLPDTSSDIYGSTKFLADGYDYDQNGNVSAISDGRPGQRGNRDFTYDGLDRLETGQSIMFGNTGTVATASYAYDVLDNLTRVVVPATASGAARNHYYCYDAKWRLTNVKTGSCAGTSVIGLGYDVQGNLANKNGMTYAFDYGNRLRSTGGTLASSYLYDGHGRRVVDETSGRKVSQYTQSGQLALSSDARTGVVTEYFYLQGSLVATRERTGSVSTGVYTTKYQHTDALGSPVAVTHQNRTLAERMEYEPYGKQLTPAATIGNDRPGYTGHVLDVATGMNYMQQRYFDSVIGRFVSVDPVTALTNGDMRFFNRYAYAFNNPYRFIDPDGRCTGSRIENDNGTCASTGTNTTMSSTAVTAQKFDSSRVQFANGTNSSNAQSQAGTVVKDANRVGGMATQSENSRLIRAFNRIKDLVVDGQNFDKVSKGAIAFTTYGGNINFSLKYFGLDTYQRTGRFIHETFHHDDAFYAMRLQNVPGCSGWSCADEPAVEFESMKFMQKN